LADNFAKSVAELNAALAAVETDKSLESGIEAAVKVLNLLGIDEAGSAADVIDSGLLKLPNSERQDPWFHPHPWMRGERAAFELVDSSVLPIQAKFYWLQKRGTAYVAGGVHFTKNWEDHDFTRTDEFKIGVDFFLNREADAILVVLSNRGKLRVMELSGKVTNTQLEIFENWFEARNQANRQLLHSILWESFKLQSVNTKFYDGVADAFAELLIHLRLQGKDEEEAKLFSSRLLGRLIFVWFLKKMNVISPSEGYFDAREGSQADYYRNHLERLFFQTLNTPVDSREAVNGVGMPDLETPYLNGGLFAPHPGDWLEEADVTFPEAFFSRLFDHFGNFNFTTDESTPEYEQVAIDPEMLGRVFESLLASQLSATGEQARKAKGAFYTPREVVAYMCKETVRGYLLSQYREDEVYRKAVVKLLDTTDQEWAIAGSNSLRDIQPETRARLQLALSQLKSLDPACGSGAFPLGLVQLLSKLHLRLDPRLDEYKLKMSILRDNIFGVDIEPMAIEISRLRAWLSLIVEERKSKSLEPLPNLDFNFVCANSLISLDGPDLFTDAALQQKLSQLRREYFEADTPSKKSKIQSAYLLLAEPDLLDAMDNRASQLKSFNPFDADHVASFFDAEHMFGVDAGFDVIVGNPPYIGMKGHSHLFEEVKNSSLGRRFFSGKMDYLYFFFHLGIDLLKVGGVMSLITTNYWPTASYAKKLVDDIRSRSTLLKVVNFNEVQIFDSAAGQHNMVTFLQKGRREELAQILNVQSSMRGKVSTEQLTGILNGSDPNISLSDVSQEQLYSNSILVINNSGDSAIDLILDKVGSSHFKLGNYAQINQGVVTGANKISAGHVQKFGLDESLIGAGVFIISRDELEALDLDEHEAQIVKPYFKNSDIRPWSSSRDTERYLIYADERFGTLDSRPKLRAHLESFKEILQVGRSSKFPYLTWPRSVEFDGPKIVAPQRSKSNTFAYNDVPWYATSDVYFITPKTGAVDLFTILGLLNSDLYLAWFYLRGKRKGEMMELFQMPLVELPLPNLGASNSENLGEVGRISKEIWLESEAGYSINAAKLDEMNHAVAKSFSFSDDQELQIANWKKEWQKDTANVALVEEIDD
jgi:hypothetical protein